MSTNPRPRLGRGLRGLISTSPLPSQATTAEPAGTEGLHLVALDLIDANPHQPRETMDPTALSALVASVKVSGVLQPVLLRPVGDRFQLVAGHRRTEAARTAGLATIPAIVRGDSTDELQAEWALIENIQREDLNALERARAYKTYIDRFALTQVQAAQRLGEERSVITNFLRILDLNPGVQELIGRGLLSAGHAKVLAGVSDSQRQDALANRCVAEGLSVRKLEEALAQTPPASSSGDITTVVASHTRTLTAKSPHIVELEQDLSRKLGTKIRIFPAKKKNTGKIVVQYFSLDEFERIVERIEKPRTPALGE